MNKILVIGCPGAGKSYFAKQLSALIQIPLTHLDVLYWNEDKTCISHDELVDKIKEVVKEDSFIIDGNYGGTLDLRLDYADTVFYLDYATDICLKGIESRVGKKHDDLPWIEEELDAEFKEYVRNFRNEWTPKVEECLKNHPNVELFHFTERKQADDHLMSLFPESVQTYTKKFGMKLIVDNHVSGDLVYQVGADYILKISLDKNRLDKERKVNDFLKGKLPVSKSIVFEKKENQTFYLKSCVEGDTLVDYVNQPLFVAERLAEAIRMFHSVDTTGCDFTNEESTGTTFVHGDFCLPNILVKDGHVSGFIDTEAAGLGDPWVDLAWCIWSFEFNLKSKEYTPYLLEKLGIDKDEKDLEKGYIHHD